MKPKYLLAAMVVLSVSVSAATAQEPDKEKKTLRGHIVDAATGQPVPVTVVRSHTAERAVVTDSSGAFVLSQLAPRIHELEAARIGYSPITIMVDVTSADTVLIQLTALPIKLEAITAVSNTLARRRERVPALVRAFDAKTLGVASGDLRQFLRSQGVFLVNCPSTAVRSSADDCVWARGRYRALNFYFNEMPFTGPPLSLYYPFEFELVEYYPNSASVRVYTTDFLERVAKGKGFISHVVQ
jgi:hypothetical protein